MVYMIEQVNIETECSGAVSLVHFNFLLCFGNFLPFKRHSTQDLRLEIASL